MSGRTSTLVATAAILGAVVLALALVHPGLMFQGRVYQSSDTQAAEGFHVSGDALREKEGVYPLWNPYVFGGMPSFGSLAYTADIYPAQKPIRWLRDTLHTPPMTWLLVHLLLAGVFTAAYARWRGMSLAAAALAGALVVALPKLSAWSAYGHGTKVGTFAWLPLTLWCIDAVLRRGKWAVAFLLAAAASMQLLRAHVQIVYYTAMAALFWVVFLIAGDVKRPELRRRVGRRAGMLAVAGILAFGAALVLYLPILDYQPHSIRGSQSQGGGVGFEYATNWSLPVSEIDTLWWPTAAGYGRGSYVGQMPFTDYPNYVGGGILLLALVGLLFRRDRFAWCLVSLALFTTLVALGRHFFLYGLLYDLLPGFKKFRVPVMILILQEFALILLAVSGLDGIARRVNDPSLSRPKWFRKEVLALTALVGAALLALGTVGASVLRENSIAAWRAQRNVPMSALNSAADLAQGDAVRLGLVALLFAGGVVFAARRRAPAWMLTAGVGALLLWDYVAVNQPLLHPEAHLQDLARTSTGIVAVEPSPLMQEPSESLLPSSEVIEWLAGQKPRARTWPLGNLGQNNVLAGHGIVSLGGYHAAKLRSYEQVRRRLFEAQPPEVSWANRLAADWLVAPGPFDETTLETLRRLGLDVDDTPSFAGEGGVVYRNRSALPRARLVGSYELEIPGRANTDSEAPPSVLDRIADPRRAGYNRVILSQEPDPVPVPGATGVAEIVEEGVHHLVVNVRASAPAVLVLADIYDSHWHALVDGEPALLLRTDFLQRGVAVPSGQHVVELRYESASFQRGRVVSFASGGIILLGLVGSLILQRRRSAGAGEV